MLSSTSIFHLHVVTLVPVVWLCVLQRLDDDLKKALRSDLENVSLALLMTPAQFNAYLLRKATKVSVPYFFYTHISSSTTSLFTF